VDKMKPIMHRVQIDAYMPKSAKVQERAQYTNGTTALDGALVILYAKAQSPSKTTPVIMMNPRMHRVQINA
jgi:hypothetical protein